jgi:hypothetical protein
VLTFDLGLEEGEDFVVIAGYVTALQLYRILYRFREKSVLVIDDVDSVFENIFCKGLLLAALATTTKRIVNYFSSTYRLEGVPIKFQFESKAIFLVNRLPKELENIKSRSFYYKTKMPLEIKKQVLYEIGKLNQIPEEVLQFVLENVNGHNIDFRLPMKIFELYKTHKNWQDLALEIMELDLSLARAFKIMKSNHSVAEQIEEFKRLGLGSERTYYYWKNKLNGTAKVQMK